MRSWSKRIFPLMACMAAILGACSRDTGPPSDPRDVIELRWLKAYERESRSDVETGLLWGLSLLGAKLPRDAEVILWHGDVMTVDVARAQVQQGTLPAWRELIAAWEPRLFYYVRRLVPQESDAWDELAADGFTFLRMDALEGMSAVLEERVIR